MTDPEVSIGDSIEKPSFPSKLELLAMRELLHRGIKDAEQNDERGLADLGLDFLAYYDDVEVPVREYEYFQREYLNGVRGEFDD